MNLILNIYKFTFLYFQKKTRTGTIYLIWWSTSGRIYSFVAHGLEEDDTWKSQQEGKSYTISPYTLTNGLAHIGSVFCQQPVVARHRHDFTTVAYTLYQNTNRYL